MESDRSGSNFRIMRFLPNITFLSVLAYILGYTFYSGYLGYYGLEVDAYPKSVDGYWMQAFLAISYVILSGVSKASKFAVHIWGAFSALIVSYSMGKIWLRRRGLLRKLKIMVAIKVQGFPRGRRFAYLSESTSIWVGSFSILYLLMIGLPAAVLVLWVGYFVGEAYGKESRLDARQCQIAVSPFPKTCVAIFKDGRLVGRGYYVVGAGDDVAVFDGLKTNNYRRDQYSFSFGVKQEGR